MVDAPSKLLQAACSLWHEGRHADAIVLFDEAIRQEPNNVRVYIMAARAYAEKFEFRRMDQTLERIIERAPRHPGVHHYIGETFGILKLPERAMASYERACQLPGAGAPTWMELAALYERAHRLDEAQTLIERTVKSGFDLPLVWLVRGRIQRRLNHPEQAESTFRELIRRLPGESEWDCQAWGEIAVLKDQLGDYEGAADAIERCKRIQKLHETPFLTASQQLENELRDVLDGITRDDFRRWRDAAKQFSPQRLALLTGFPRSGTTLLEQVLDTHPDIISSEERDYIGRELLHSVATGRGKTSLLELIDSLSIGEIDRHRERYFQAMEYLLSEPIGGRMHLDKNPSYNLLIPLVLRVFPEARLIVALRDPRDVVLSCYLRYLPLNAVSVHFLDIERTAARYVLDMTAWIKLREIVEVPFCEIRYEDVVANLEAEARRALDTLGVDWDDRVLDYRDRVLHTKQVTSPTYETVAQPMYTRSIGRWKNYAKLLEPSFKTLEPVVREFGYSV